VATLAPIEFSIFAKSIARFGAELKPAFQMPCAGLAFGIALVASPHSRQALFDLRPARQREQYIGSNRWWCRARWLGIGHYVCCDIDHASKSYTRHTPAREHISISGYSSINPR
jgi:hypothetical protein